MDTDAYLDRLGLDPASVPAFASGDDPSPDREDIARLQRAHVTSIPFETFSVNGDPFGPYVGETPSVDPRIAVEKITRRRRGGWCFELNGAFARLLESLGAEPIVLAARMLGQDGARPPANHRITLVDFDGLHVVDVGTDSPMLREPLPLDGTPVTDETGHTWRIVESGRPDADFLTQFREPDVEEWTDRYVFRTEPRDSSYFAPTAEFLATAPESAFTDGPIVILGTEEGHASLSTQSFRRSRRGETVVNRPVEPAEWHRILDREFGIDLPG